MLNQLSVEKPVIEFADGRMQKQLNTVDGQAVREQNEPLVANRNLLAVCHSCK